MKSDDLEKLIQSEKYPLCISLIIPTDRLSKARNYELLKNAMRKARKLMSHYRVPGEVSNRLNHQLEAVFVRVPKTVSAGLGIYLSPDEHWFVLFPFDVKQKIIVGEQFEIRDLLYLREYAARYCVLNLSKKGVQLYQGTLNTLTEVNDGNFPLLYHDTFEYARATRADSTSNSLKGFEREKNDITEIRLTAVFRDADAYVRKYLADDTRILVAGTQRMIALFRKVSTLKHHLAGQVSGSYNENHFEQLQQAAWETIIRIRSKAIDEQIEAIREKRNGLVVEGMRQAWEVASEGKGQLLLVEKDFHRRGYRKPGERKLYLQPPVEPYEVIPDVVDTLIDVVRSKKGDVVFTENGKLEDFAHLALVLRY
jgi:hypothetical protein